MKIDSHAWISDPVLPDHDRNLFTDASLTSIIDPDEAEPVFSSASL